MSGELQAQEATDLDVRVAQSQQGMTVIIPTYNERENIKQIIARCLDALHDEPFETEILVVDDDSPDRTWEVAREAFALEDNVRVIRRQDVEPGLAQSVTDGFHEAEQEYCAVIDADLQHPPEKLRELFGALEDGADIAIGSRHIDGGGIENWSATRKVISKGATLVAKTALPDARDLSDPMSGFFAVRRDVVDDVELDARGYKILLEVIAKGDYETITEVPYVFSERERGESNLTADEYQNFLEHLGSLAVTSYGLDSRVDPWRAVRAAEFSAIGAIGTVVNMAVFAIMTLLFSTHYLTAGVVAFLVAVNWNFVGNWLITFNRPREDILGQYKRFHLVSIGGFVIYTVTLSGLVIAGAPELVANAVAILAGALLNFVGSDDYAFSTNSSESTDAEVTFTEDSTTQSD